MSEDVAWADPDEHQFFVPDRARWGAIQKTATNIGEALNKACAALEEQNPALEGVLAGIDYNDERRLAHVGVYIGVQPTPRIPPSGDPATDAGRLLGGLISMGAQSRNQVTVYTMMEGQPAVVLYSGRTRRFGNAVKDACNAILDAAGVER